MNEIVDPNLIECPKCPVCGKQTDTFYRRKDFVIVGCPECISDIDAWDWGEDHKLYYSDVLGRGSSQ